MSAKDLPIVADHKDTHGRVILYVNNKSVLTTDRVTSNQNPIWNAHAVITAWKNTALRFEVSSIKVGQCYLLVVRGDTK